jgi:hypothetical protein
MMTDRLNISILSAPLAAIDRRSLSEAWYSALRLARDVHERAQSRRQPVAQPIPSGATRNGSAALFRASARAGDRAPTISDKHSTPRSGRVVTERRMQRSQLSRDIERIFLDPRRVANRATFTVGNGGERVHVILQNKGNRVALIAICPPTARKQVARALAQARYALVGRGICVDVEQSVDACS